MARFPPSAVAALLAVVSSTSGGENYSPAVGASAYIAPLPTNFQNNRNPSLSAQRRNTGTSHRHRTELAASRSGTSSSTFRPLFDDANRPSVSLDGGDSSRRIPKTGSTGGVNSLDQSAVNRANRGRPSGPGGGGGDEFGGRPTRGPQQPRKKKGPLWGMFNGNGDGDGKADTSSGSRGATPERVRLSDLGKDTEPAMRSDANSERGGDDGPRSSGKKQVWGGRYAGSGPANSTALTDSSYFGPRGPGGPGPGGMPGPYGPPPDEFMYDDEFMDVEEQERRMFEQRRMDGRGDRMDGPGPGGPGPAGGGGVDAYGRPSRGAGRMNAPPMEAPRQEGMKNGGAAGGGGGGGRREPSLFDKVSNFVADSGTIAVLKVSYYHYHYIIIARWE